MAVEKDAWICRETWLLAVIVSRLAEGEPLTGALVAAGLSESAYHAWRARDAGFCQSVDNAALEGRVFLFWHEHYEELRQQEELLTRYCLATLTGDTSGLPPAWADRVRWLGQLQPPPSHERVRRTGADGVARRHLWKKRKTPKRERPLCGATTRAGGTCAARAVPGKRRCRIHGGLTPPWPVAVPDQSEFEALAREQAQRSVQFLNSCRA